MKKINNKGITLVELIVSFILVTVAVIYFYQTLFTVKKLYTKTIKETTEYVDREYVLRLADAYLDKNCPEPRIDNKDCYGWSTVTGYHTSVDYQVINVGTDGSKGNHNYKIRFCTGGGTDASLYKYVEDYVPLGLGKKGEVRRFKIRYCVDGKNCDKLKLDQSQC